MKKPRHQVSDHALVRYMQRAMKLDVEQLRRELGRKVDAATAGFDGMTAVNIDGCQFRLDGTVVTTVLLRSRSVPLTDGPKRRRERDDA